MLSKIKGTGIQLAKRIGRFSTWSDAERRMKQADAVWFNGDIPPMAGREHNQYRVVYTQPRPLISHARNVLYTADGMGWIGRCLHGRYSFYEGGLKQILQKPRRPVTTYEKASILQSQTPCTFGDWVSEHVASIGRAMIRKEFVEPLLVPERWYNKPYVKRDLQIMGVNAVPVTGPVLIKQATVIHKTRSSHHWIREEAEGLIAGMKFTARPCKPGTGIYLSRRGEKGEGPKRELRNDLTEAAMEAAGVLVARTAGRSREDYMALADYAETVFGDHGSAFYNMPHWQTRRVVELCSPAYWDPSFLFFADSLGIHDYHVWQIDQTTTLESLTQRIRTILNRPVGLPYAADDAPAIQVAPEAQSV